MQRSGKNEDFGRILVTLLEIAPKLQKKSGNGSMMGDTPQDTPLLRVKKGGVLF